LRTTARPTSATSAQLLQLGLRLLAGFLGELGLLDAGFDLRRLVAAVLALAELLLDRLHLLVQVVLALGLLHLALDARADALLDLQHRDFGFHEAHRLLQPLLDGQRGEHFLLFRDLDRQMRGDSVGELGVSSIWLAAPTTSGEIFLFSFT
jgi:hypothetical protein